MCGIFAYNWKENALPFLIEWLRNLEYRGYDSAGAFGINNSGEIFLEKAVGKVSNLATKVETNNKKDKQASSEIPWTYSFRNCIYKVMNTFSNIISGLWKFLTSPFTIIWTFFLKRN